MPRVVAYTCGDCGGPKPRGRGRRFCDDCKARHTVREHPREQCWRDGCTNEKRPGQGQKLCEPCHADSLARYPKATRPCHGCGTTENKRKGKQLCEACKEIADWRQRTRRRARRAANRKVCAGCLKLKGPGSRKRYCATCEAKRQDPRRRCNGCGELKTLVKWAKTCADCKREARKVRLARQRAYAMRVRQDPERAVQIKKQQSASKKRNRAKENERHRILYRLKALDAGREVATSSHYTRDKGRTSALPLRPLIDRFVDVWNAENENVDGGGGAVAELTERAHVSQRLLYRIRYETDSVTVDAADKICLALGTTYALVYDTDAQQEAA